MNGITVKLGVADEALAIARKVGLRRLTQIRDSLDGQFAILVIGCWLLVICYLLFANNQ
jgi:hypothetical protein